MAEIKSTRDLIMERTKNLTMTDEEKKALRARELRGKVKGWVQKCIDGIVGIPRLQGEIRLEMAKEPALSSILFQDLLERIDPDGENDLLLQMMESFLSRDTVLLRELLAAFRTELAEKIRERTVQAKNDLAMLNISGSAVVPNLDRDPDWKNKREALKNSCVGRIRATVTF